MNYLCHCYFSELTPDALIGSLWPDFGKRPAEDDVSASLLAHFDKHQEIDRLTDHHPMLEPLRRILRPTYRKTTPVIIDMLFDHHLAKHWPDFHDHALENFAATVYQKFRVYQNPQLPNRLSKTLHHMAKDNWLVAYRYPTGIEQALNGMSKRLHFKNPLNDHTSFALGTEQEFSHLFSEFLRFLANKTN